tara:strand:- start:370 stop:489 length:120 start_codon:yes stop_codon:yes gene_type:complete
MAAKSQRQDISALNEADMFFFLSKKNHINRLVTTVAGAN